VLAGLFCPELARLSDAKCNPISRVISTRADAKIFARHFVVYFFARCVADVESRASMFLSSQSRRFVSQRKPSMLVAEPSQSAGARSAARFAGFGQSLLEFCLLRPDMIADQRCEQLR
jgi:hypothetical protein